MKLSKVGVEQPIEGGGLIRRRKIDKLTKIDTKGLKCAFTCYRKMAFISLCRFCYISCREAFAFRTEIMTNIRD